MHSALLFNASTEVPKYTSNTCCVAFPDQRADLATVTCILIHQFCSFLYCKGTLGTVSKGAVLQYPWYCLYKACTLVLQASSRCTVVNYHPSEAFGLHLSPHQLRDEMTSNPSAVQAASCNHKSSSHCKSRTISKALAKALAKELANSGTCCCCSKKGKAITVKVKVKKFKEKHVVEEE